jgi:eukaryotic-like serine/threonine-protein kinase
VDDVSTRAPARVLADRYALIDRIGSGGAGVVWRAHDQLLDRTVAVKLLHRDLASDPDTTERFRAEAAAAAKLTHPHAVIVYDIGATDGGDYLVMELVEGATLGDLLDHDGPLPAGVVAALGHQVGRALGAAHARGLVHRDVKPANILVTTDGVAKVADFGIARALGEATSRLTATGHVMGTARYLAPEQLRDQRIDARADVYALGLVLHQCVTGRLPFGEGTAVEVASRRLVGELPAPSQLRPEVPDGFDEAIARATLLDPEGRFADGAEFAAALAGLAAPYAGTELASRTRRCIRADHRGRSTDTGPTGAPVVPPAGAWTPDDRTPVDGTPQVDGAEADPHAAETTAAIAATPRRSPRSTAPPAAVGSAPAGPAAPSTEDGARGGPRSGGRGRLVWASLLVLALVAVGVFAALRGSDDEPPVAEGDDGTESAEEAPAPIEVTGGGDHDPFGSGGGEHPDRVPEAFDGDPETYWRTQQYRGNPELGGLKPGVGIWLDLGEPREVGELVVSTTNPGASFTVFAGDAPPEGGEAPEDWGTAVAEVTDAGADQSIGLEEATEAQVWLLWFTSLPPDGGNYRATVSEVGFEAS